MIQPTNEIAHRRVTDGQFRKPEKAAMQDITLLSPTHSSKTQPAPRQSYRLTPEKLEQFHDAMMDAPRQVFFTFSREVTAALIRAARKGMRE